MFLEKEKTCASDGESPQGGDSSVGWRRVKGRLMLGILITLRAADPARTSRRGPGVKTKTPPDQTAAAPLPLRLQLCFFSALGGSWHRTGKVTQGGDRVHWPFRGLKVCVTERSGFRGKDLSVPAHPARPLWDFWSRPSPSKSGLKNFLSKQCGVAE